MRDVENGASNRIADLQGAGETTIPLRQAGSGEELSADTAAIERLAGLSPFDCDRCRQTEAKRLLRAIKSTGVGG